MMLALYCLSYCQFDHPVRALGLNLTSGAQKTMLASSQAHFLFLHSLHSCLTCLCSGAGLPGTVKLGRLPGPPNANALLSFHKAPPSNLAAPAAAGGESTLNIVTRRDQYTQPANQAPSSEVNQVDILLIWYS